MSGQPAGQTYTAPFAVRFGWIVAMAILTTAWYLLIRIASDGGVPYLGIAFWQCAGGGAITGLVLILRRRRVPLSRRHLIFYFVSGLLGGALPYITTALASPNAPMGIIAMGLTIEPALTYMFALLLLLERFRTLRFLGLLIGIAGLMLILVPEAALPSRAMVPWVLVSLGLPIGQALWNNYIAFARPPDVDSHVLAFGLLVAAAVMMLPAVIATDSLWWLNGDGPGSDLWWPVAALATMNSFGWIAGFESIRVSGPVFYSAYTFMGTPLALGVGMVVFDEHHSAWVWSALVLLLVSLYLVNMTMAAARRRA